MGLMLIRRRKWYCSVLVVLACSCSGDSRKRGNASSETGAGSDRRFFEEHVEGARKGDPKDQLVVADCYSHGRCGVAKDDGEAVKWYRLCAERVGWPSCQATLALKYVTGGVNLKQDYREAAKWWHRLAEAGDEGAQHALGSFYAEGLGVPQNFSEAVKWYRLSAVQGNASSQQSMGRMYVRGEGVRRDYVTAHMWLNLACVGDRQEACAERERLSRTMTADQIGRAQKMASDWKPSR